MVKTRKCLRLRIFFGTILLIALLIGIADSAVIYIDPIGDKHVGDKFTITAQTNLAVDDEVLVEVYSSSFKPTQKSPSGEFRGTTGTMKVQKGDSGMNTISFDVDSSTFKPDEYIVSMQAVIQEATGTALFNVLEGAIVTAVPTADSNGTGKAGGAVTITGAGAGKYYLGENIRLTGTADSTVTVYLYITGPNLPNGGGSLTHPTSEVTSGSAASFTGADVLSDGTWDYRWETKRLDVNYVYYQGHKEWTDHDPASHTYTVYAVSAPVTVHGTSSVPPGVMYSSFTFTLDRPSVSATGSSSTIQSGESYYIQGTSEGSPSYGIAVWMITDGSVDYRVVPVSADGSFRQDYTPQEMAPFAGRRTWIAVQHPMMDDRFDVYPSGLIYDGGPPVTVISNYPSFGTTIFPIAGPGRLEGSDASTALINALSDQNIDDTYLKLGLNIPTTTITTTPTSTTLTTAQPYTTTVEGTATTGHGPDIPGEVVTVIAIGGLGAGAVATLYTTGNIGQGAVKTAGETPQPPRPPRTARPDVRLDVNRGIEIYGPETVQAEIDISVRAGIEFDDGKKSG